MATFCKTHGHEMRQCGFDVQVGTHDLYAANVSIPANAYLDIPVAFPRAFDAVPQVFIACGSSSTASLMAYHFPVVYQRSTTGFTVRWYSKDTADRTPSRIDWVAISAVQAG